MSEETTEQIENEFNEEEIFKYISNYSGLNLSYEEKNLIFAVVENHNYKDIFKKHDPSFILIKFFQENESNKNLGEEGNLASLFHYFIKKFENTVDLESCKNNNSLIQVASLGLQSKELKKFEKDYINILYKICHKEGLMDDEEGKPYEGLKTNEVQKTIIEIERKIDLFYKGLNRNNGKLYDIKAIANISGVTIAAMVFYLGQDISNNYVLASIGLLSFILSRKHGENISDKYVHGEDIRQVNDFYSFISIIEESLSKGEKIPTITNKTVKIMYSILNRTRL